MIGVHSEHSTSFLPWNKGGTGGIEIRWNVGVRLGMIFLAILHWDRVTLKPFSLDTNQKGGATSKGGNVIHAYDFLSTIPGCDTFPWVEDGLEDAGKSALKLKRRNMSIKGHGLAFDSPTWEIVCSTSCLKV